jgi:hypothetical protein
MTAIVFMSGGVQVVADVATVAQTSAGYVLSNAAEVELASFHLSEVVKIELV